MAEGTGDSLSFSNLPSDLLLNISLENDASFFPDFNMGDSTLGGGTTGPYLEILEQPKSRGFRFRYSCEGPSHGGLPGERSEKGNKTFPSVQVNNYVGPARIEVTLVTAAEPARPHAHSLVGKNVRDGACITEIGPETGMTATFPNLGVQHVTKKNVKLVLADRYLKMQKLNAAMLANGNMADSAVNPSEASTSDGNQTMLDRNMAESVANEERKKIETAVDEQAKNMNLSTVRLCFQTYLPDELGRFVRCLPPVCSNQIYDSKAAAASELKICRIDRQAGFVNGNEEVFLLCDKVQKEDIEVRFFENQNGKEWEDFGKFSTSDVHRQFAIVFKTPAYWNVAIEKPVTVQIELRRKSDKETSNLMEFIYKPTEFDPEHIGAKRRKKVPHFGDYSDAGGSGGLSGAGAGGGGSGIGFLDQATVSQFFSLFSGGASGSGGMTHSSQGQPPQDMEQRDSAGDGSLSEKEQNRKSFSMETMSAVLSQSVRHMVATTKSFEHFSQTDDVRYLLGAQRHHTALPNEDGDSALHVAIINSHPSIVKSLLDVDSNPNYVNQFNHLRQSPLHLAVITQQPELIGRLLQAGADVTLQDRHGNTPLHLASQQHSPACVKALVARPPPGNYTQCSNKYPELNTQNYDGLTAVHLSVQLNQLENLKILSSMGADMDARDGKSGFSPLHYAVEADNLSVAGYLILTAKVDIDIPSIDGNTALHLSSGHGLKSITALLVAAGADVKFVNNEEETAVELATTLEVREMLEGQVGTSLVPTVSISTDSCSMSDELNSMNDNLDMFSGAERIEFESFLSSDWKSLAQRLNMDSYVSALALQKNPAKHLLDAYETVDGSALKLLAALVDLGNRNAASMLDRSLESVNRFHDLPRFPKHVWSKDTGHFSGSFNDTDSAYGSFSTTDASLASYQGLGDSKDIKNRPHAPSYLTGGKAEPKT